MTLDIIIPCYNEADGLEDSVLRLHAFLSANLEGWDWGIIIVDNASTDRTEEVARKMAAGFGRVSARFLPEKGKGLAVKHGSLLSAADVVAFTDADLAVGLEPLLPMLDSIRAGECDLCVASRKVERGGVRGRRIVRSVMSHGYSLLFRLLFRIGVRDVQCGMKMWTRRTADQVLTQVEDDGFFFDSELIVLAKRAGYRVKEIPVVMLDDGRSTVNLRRDVPYFLGRLVKLRLRVRRSDQ